MTRRTSPPPQTTGSARPGASRPTAVIVALGVIGILFLLPAAMRPVGVQNYYLALLLTVVTLLPIALRIASGAFDVFEPIVPISLLICLAFGLRAMFLAFDPQTMLEKQFAQLPFDDYVDRALILALAAYASLLFGYFVVARVFPIKPLAARRFARRTWPASGVNAMKVAALLGLAIVASYVSRGRDDTVTGATSMLGIMSGFCHVSAGVIALYLAAGDQRQWLRVALWGVAIPLAAWQSLVFGAKTYVLEVFYIVIAARHYAKRRVRLSVLAVSAVVLILTVFPIVNGYRQDPAELRRLLSTITAPEYAQLAVESLLSRSTGIDSLSLLMKYDVSDQLGQPEAYPRIPLYAFIPRIIWSDKPVIAQGTNFGRLFLTPSFQGANSFASFGLFHIGDLYVSFGISGVLIGMCILGVLYRLIYRFLDPQNSSDLGIKFLYIIMLWSMVNGFEGDIPSTYSSLLKNLAVWWAIKLWLNEPVRGEAMRRAPNPLGRRWISSPTRLATGQPSGLHTGDVRPGFSR